MLARMPHDETRKRHLLPDMAEVVDELASYNERMAHGTWVLPPGEDVLTQVLGTEHGGCIKGVGSHVGYKRGIPGYIEKPRRNRQKKEIEVIQERMDERYKKREVEMEERHKQREMEMEERHKQKEMEMEKRHKHREMELEERYKQREMDL